jgi:signal transduction histidine kinase
VETNVPDAVISQPCLSRKFYNLISNAIRYSNPEKRPIVKISLVEESGNKILQVG